MKTVLSLFSVVLVSSSMAFAGVFFEPVAGSNKIYRGRAPKPSEMQGLVNSGIDTVVIFKNQIKTEVNDEIDGFTKLGLDPKKIYNIPFQWKDIKDEEKACEQVVQALSILNQVEKSTQDKVFFHCTVGEDRTGLLAGLISQIISNESMQSSFADEMCAKGYADGNPNKPKSVSAAVLKSLNPIYYKVSKLIETKQITRDHIDPAVCGKVANIEFSGQVQSCSSLK